tara:strand:+ start:1356 stop:2825 length:1470 start_codon:yes stop_codon:yes gene_type:complete
MKILYLPHAMRNDFYFNLLKSLKKKNMIQAIINPGSEKVYISILGDEKNILIWPNSIQIANLDLSEEKKKESKHLINQIEKKSSISVNRIFLANERNIGRAYSRNFYFWNDDSKYLRLINNKNLYNKYLLNLFYFANKFFNLSKPEVVISGITSPAMHFAIYLICKVKKTPFLVNRKSKVHSNRCYWTKDFNMLNLETEQQIKSSIKYNSNIRNIGEDYLKKFRKKPFMVGYIKKNWERGGSIRKWSSWHFKSLMLLYNNVKLNLKKIPITQSSLDHLIEWYRLKFLGITHSKFMKNYDEKSLIEKNYIYFPLHKEPELAINFQAYGFHSQFETIKKLSVIIPFDYTLLIKEHRGTWGRRKTKFYTFLNNLPNVEFISPFDDQYKYIKNANLIITDNGSTGWEGILLKKKVICLFKNFYNFNKLCITVNDYHELNSKIIRTLESKESEISDEKIIDFIIAEYRSTFNEMEKKLDEKFYIALKKLKGAHQ